MSEEDKGVMEKKPNSRQSSVPPKANSNDSKKENGTPKNQKGKRRGNNGFSGGNFSYNEGPVRKATPQKYKNTWDKRPRSRGGYSDRPRSDLEENAVSEYGSAIHSGSKKGSLNHLLNFTYAPSEAVQSYQGGWGSGSWSRGRQLRYKNSYSSRSKVCYNKEQFLQANCQFVVKAGEDYSVHLMDPDVLVKWEAVEQVRVTSLEPPSCPICLQYPTAAKMTRCGHIYCWACILHYLALGEKNWRKCPICYESIHSQDLKSVVVREVQHYKVGDSVTMTLMKKEKGSIYAVPAHYWSKQEKRCHNVDEPAEMTHHLKLLIAKHYQVLDILGWEKKQLALQLTDAEPSEEPFIIAAQAQLKEREESVTGVKKLQEEITLKQPTEKPPVTNDESSLPTRKHTSSKKIKQYKSAFSDEEEEGEPSDPEEPGSRDVDNQSSDSRQQSSGGEENKSDHDSSRPVSPHLDGTVKAEQNTSQQEEKKSPRASPPMPVIGADNDIQDSEKFSVGSPQCNEPPIEVIPDIMPVEEAAEHLELPAQGDGKVRKKSGDECFYFYQAADGQHLYLHSLNARCLVREYGSLENSPQQITATIVEKESVFVTEELRKRLRYLSHLPLTCGFEVVELDIKPPVIGKDTLKYFQDETEKRRRQRQRRNREEKRRARQIEEIERKRLGISKDTTIVRSQFNQPQTSLPVSVSFSQLGDCNRSDTSSPSLDTPVGSPLGRSISAPDFQPITTSPSDDGQTATVSFAQMLKAGAQTTKWPKLKTDQLSPPTTAGARHGGSDESDNEDRVPVPEFHSSFGSAIEAALETIGSKKELEEQKPASGTGGKKKKKQLVLFSTSMARGGK